VVDARPLHAYVAKSNVASIRVLEKCGFVKVGEHAGDDGIEELLLELRDEDRPELRAQGERA
jgi:RimJ/RimL family protein N-acetyltransferase